jgi:hypothetical protein
MPPLAEVVLSDEQREVPRVRDDHPSCPTRTSTTQALMCRPKRGHSNERVDVGVAETFGADCGRAVCGARSSPRSCDSCSRRRIAGLDAASRFQP